MGNTLEKPQFLKTFTQCLIGVESTTRFVRLTFAHLLTAKQSILPFRSQMQSIHLTASRKHKPSQKDDSKIENKPQNTFWDIRFIFLDVDFLNTISISTLAVLLTLDVDNVFDSFIGYLQDHKLDLGVHVPFAQIEHRGFSPNVELGKEKDYSPIYVFMLRSVQYCVGIINLLSILSYNC